MKRRDFLKIATQAVSGVALFGSAGFLLKESRDGNLPEIDAEKCKGCGQCASSCIFTPSAVKCYNIDEICSNCTACYGYHSDTNAEPIDKSGLICPENAIIRESRPEELGGGFTYTIDQKKCIGCGKCVRLCWKHGSKSMRLVVDHTICRRCNKCQIANVCDGEAFSCKNG